MDPNNDPNDGVIEAEADEILGDEAEGGEGEEADGAFNEGEALARATAEGEVLMQELRSKGYAETSVQALVNAQADLIIGAAELNHCKEWPPKPNERVRISIVSPLEDPDRVISDAGMSLLLPWWRNFSESLNLAPASKEGYIHLRLEGLEIGSVVSSLPLGTVPLKSLQLDKNGLGRDEKAPWDFIFNTIKANPTLTCVSIESNLISAENAATLVDVLTSHPTIDAVLLHSCGLGKETKAAQCLIQFSLRNMTEVSLDNNGIGSPSGETLSYSVALIAIGLSENHIVQSLDLEDNQLKDGDASVLAWSLKTNTNLLTLRLRGNKITENGFSILRRALCDGSSFDRILDSNHNCLVETDGDALSDLNNCHDADMNKKKKLLLRLPVVTDHSCTDGLSGAIMGNIADIPIGIVPHFMVCVQGMESLFTVNKVKINSLDTTFRLLRHWNMPLLFTSTAGPYPRRSNRIRAKKVSHLRGNGRSLY